MAKRQQSSEATVMDLIKAGQSRGGQYASYFTEMGWQRWDAAAEVVEQQIRDRKLQYQEAVDIYQKELAALQKRRGDLEKRLADIQVKKASAQIKREDAEWKEKQARARATYKAETQKKRDEAYVASTSYSHGWSKSYGTGTGSTVRTAGGRDALDESLDDVGADGGQTAKQAISGSVGLATDIPTAAAQLRDIKVRQENGDIDNTQYGAGVTLYAAHRYMVSKLAQTLPGNLTEDQVKVLLDAELNDATINNDIDYGAQVVLDRAQQGTGSGSRVSESQRQAGAKGGYYGNYELPKMEPVTKEAVNLKPLEDAEASIKKDLEAVSGQTPVKAVLEPVDVITATRDEYLRRFGDVPRGTSLQMGGETIGKYKNLMPYELTNALGKVQTFFKNYIQAELSAAQTAAGTANLSSDDFNAAVERGKAKAREVLFGGLAARDPQYAATITSPNATAGATSAAASTSIPTDARGWASVGVNRPETGNVEADNTAYQKSKEEWVKANTVPATPREPLGFIEEQMPYDKLRMQGREADMAAARAAGLLPVVDEAMAGVNAPLDLREAVGNLRAPPVTESDYARLFRDRVLPTPAAAVSPEIDIGAMLEAQRRRIESDDLRRRSMEGERRAPMIDSKPEGEIGPIPAPSSPTPRPLGDILLRGFKPELERGTGRVIVPPMTPQQRQDAIVGMTSGAGQANLFPESMSSSAPRRTSEGLSARPLGVNEVFPRAAPTTQPFVPSTGAGIFSPTETAEEFKARKEAFDALRNSEVNPELKGKVDKLKPPAPTPKPEQGATLDQRDTRAKIEAVATGTKMATENPAAAGKIVTKDAMGKYIAAVYDENKGKGQKAKPLGELTQTIIREYAGNPDKQKKAVEILSSLAALDTTSSKINS